MYRLTRMEATAETGSRRLKAFEPENRMPHESGGGDMPIAGADQSAAQQAQIQDLQDQLRAQILGGLQPFKDALDQYNPQFFQTGQQIQGLAGAFSPANIMALQQANQTAQLQNISQTFGRLGEGNTTAELNALNRAQAGFGTQNIQALMSGANAQAGLLGQSLDPINQGLTNLTIPEQLRIMLESARNAGKSQGGGSGSQCCFIVLEATDGILPDVIRRYRDEQCTPRKRRGYYRLAEVLVPAMRRSPWAKQAIRWGMVKPLTAYGRWYYGESRWGWVASPLKWIWLGLFTALGYGQFKRRNGEVI